MNMWLFFVSFCGVMSIGLIHGVYLRERHYQRLDADLDPLEANPSFDSVNDASYSWYSWYGNSNSSYYGSFDLQYYADYYPPYSYYSSTDGPSYSPSYSPTQSPTSTRRQMLELSTVDALNDHTSHDIQGDKGTIPGDLLSHFFPKTYPGVFGFIAHAIHAIVASRTVPSPKLTTDMDLLRHKKHQLQKDDSCTIPQDRCNPEHRVCTLKEVKEYNPVCGCDGKTYDNACVARYVYCNENWTVGACTSDHEKIIVS